jgi:hypothetical protein
MNSTRAPALAAKDLPVFSAITPDTTIKLTHDL